MRPKRSECLIHTRKLQRIKQPFFCGVFSASRIFFRRLFRPLMLKIFSLVTKFGSLGSSLNELLLTAPGVMSILMFTSKSWTENRSVVRVGEVSLVTVTSAELGSVDGFMTVSDGNDPAAAVSTCWNQYHHHHHHENKSDVYKPFPLVYYKLLWWCQTYSYLPSQTLSPPFVHYKIMLLGDRGTCVSKTCPELLPDSGMAGLKLTTC